jgi:probable phosphoglycerate mutase
LYPEQYVAWQAREVDARMPAGERVAETFREFYQRSTGALMQWAERHPDQTIAVVAHGGVLECAYRAAAGGTLGGPRDFEIRNASINRFRYADGKLSMLHWGDVSHLEAPAIDEI